VERHRGRGPLVGAQIHRALDPRRGGGVAPAADLARGDGGAVDPDLAEVVRDPQVLPGPVGHGRRGPGRGDRDLELQDAVVAGVGAGAARRAIVVPQRVVAVVELGAPHPGAAVPRGGRRGGRAAVGGGHEVQRAALPVAGGGQRRAAQVEEHPVENSWFLLRFVLDSALFQWILRPG